MTVKCDERGNIDLEDFRAKAEANKENLAASMITYPSTHGIFEADIKKMTRADEIFTNFIRLVELHYKHERRVGWYAEMLTITPKYLSETVKGVSGRTPNEWIDSYVTLEVRVLLKTSSKSIKEIADELHFPNQSFLGKFFREHVGMTPTAYRRQS